MRRYVWPVATGVAGLAAVVLLVICVTLVAATANAQSKREAAERDLRQRSAQLVSVAAQRDAAVTAVKGCGAAYDTSDEVNGELRDEMSDVLTQLGDYAASYGATTLNSDELASRISDTNSKQLAIDSTPCEFRP